MIDLKYSLIIGITKDPTLLLVRC